MGEKRRWTRRQFLEMVGAAGGSTAVYQSMVAMGLMKTPKAYAGPPRLPKESGRGKTVLILGAGVAGLTAAFELSKAGYECRILEAAPRAGGRNYTVRSGDFIYQEGKPRQVCMFDTDQYLNAGPGRIPYHHQAVLAYCRELDVALQVYVMENRAALFQTPDAFNGQSRANRRIANDTRGRIAEMLAKVVNQNVLDEELLGDDKENLLSLLQSFGQLDEEYQYKYSPRYQGNWRAGYVIEPNVETPGLPEPELSFTQLLDSQFWLHRFYQPEDYEWQATMFQPVGGMDKIIDGFLRRIRSLVCLNQQVVGLQNNEDGVMVRVQDTQTGAEDYMTADFCISNMPLPILDQVIENSGEDSGFDPFFKEAVAAVPFAPTCKVGWQAEERFWENEANRIYGGISWTNQTITQIWYPSADFFTQKGVLTGCYNFGDNAVDFGDLDLESRLLKAMDQATRVHPEFPDYVPLDLGLSIAWQQVPHQFGGWADYQGVDPRYYERLLQSDRHFWVTGDQVSYLPGWQEGAILSAHHVIEQVSQVVSGVWVAAKRGKIREVPRGEHQLGMP
ncbi:MAG: FAD-dependent oxidoreductase [Acidobacteriota bacterium]|nr:FAD-dependent oxidoreductase [Acidobacteriota bacterium]